MKSEITTRDLTGAHLLSAHVRVDREVVWLTLTKLESSDEATNALNSGLAILGPDGTSSLSAVYRILHPLAPDHWTASSGGANGDHGQIRFQCDGGDDAQKASRFFAKSLWDHLEASGMTVLPLE